jgi:hypothetical protein
MVKDMLAKFGESRAEASSTGPTVQSACPDDAVHHKDHILPRGHASWSTTRVAAGPSPEDETSSPSYPVNSVSAVGPRRGLRV